MLIRYALFILAATCILLQAACRSSSKPTSPAPSLGSIVLQDNQSTFLAHVSAGLGDCSRTERIDPEPDDFTDVLFSADIMCVAEAQGEWHSARIDGEAALEFTFDGPDGQVSQIRLWSLVHSNRSATGLASSSMATRVILRFEILDDPVPFRAVGDHECHDNSIDYYKLSDVSNPAAPDVLFQIFCQSQTGDLGMDEHGVLEPGIYELRLFVTAQDWWAEEAEFRLIFGG